MANLLEEEWSDSVDHDIINEKVAATVAEYERRGEGSSLVDLTSGNIGDLDPWLFSRPSGSSNHSAATGGNIGSTSASIEKFFGDLVDAVPTPVDLRSGGKAIRKRSAIPEKTQDVARPKTVEGLEEVDGACPGGGMSRRSIILGAREVTQVVESNVGAVRGIDEAMKASVKMGMDQEPKPPFIVIGTVKERKQVAEMLGSKSIIELRRVTENDKKNGKNNSGNAPAHVVSRSGMAWMGVRS